MENRNRLENQPNIQIVRSDRKTLGLEIRTDGSILIRAPYRVSEKRILKFLEEQREWIDVHQRKVMERRAALPETEPLSPEEIRKLGELAVKLIPERAAYYAPLVGVSYGRITIRCQRTRWGSCSSKGNLNFNCLLMLTPPEVIDSVVVHELCHRKEMNHSARFYQEVYRVFPEYDRWNRWLKENGAVLMRRIEQ